MQAALHLPRICLPISSGPVELAQPRPVRWWVRTGHDGGELITIANIASSEMDHGLKSGSPVTAEDAVMSQKIYLHLLGTVLSISCMNIHGYLFLEFIRTNDRMEVNGTALLAKRGTPCED